MARDYILGEVCFAVALLSVLICLCFSVNSIFAHLKHYTRPDCQRSTLRLLCMVPVYALSSLFSLSYPKYSEYFDFVRELYEAFALYEFFTFLVSYLGGTRELLVLMEDRPRVRHVKPLSYIFTTPLDFSNPDTFLAIRRGVFQYVAVKPILAIIVMALRACGKYSESDVFNPRAPYVYLTLAYNVSISLTMYCLVLFYSASAYDLRALDPLPKFACVKMVLFFSFWQACLISILATATVFDSYAGPYDVSQFAAAISNFLICLEVPFFAYAHYRAFHWHDFQLKDTKTGACRLPIKYAIRDAIGFNDIFLDLRHLFRGTRFKVGRILSATEILERRMDDGENSFLLGAEKRRYKSGTYSESTGYLPTRSDHMWTSGNASQEQVPATNVTTGGNSRLDVVCRESSVSFCDIDDEGEREVETLYKQSRTLRYGDYKYLVIEEPIFTT